MTVKLYLVLQASSDVDKTDSFTSVHFLKCGIDRPGKKLLLILEIENFGIYLEQNFIAKGYCKFYS